MQCSRPCVRSFVDVAVLVTLMILLAFATLVLYGMYVAPLGWSDDCTIDDSTTRRISRDCIDTWRIAISSTDSMTPSSSPPQPTPIVKQYTVVAFRAAGAATVSSFNDATRTQGGEEFAAVQTVPILAPTGTIAAAVVPTGTIAAAVPTGTIAAAVPTGTIAAAVVPTGTIAATVVPTGTIAATVVPTGTIAATVVPTIAPTVPTTDVSTVDAAPTTVASVSAVPSVTTLRATERAVQRETNRWIRTVYAFRPYKIRAECATVSLRDVADFHRELAPPKGQFREFVANTGSHLLPDSDYVVEPANLWRVDLRGIVRYALLESSAVRRPSEPLWTAYVASLDIVTWRREFGDRLPAELARLLDANDEETLLRLGVLLATRYIGPLGSVAANHPSVLRASFDRLDDHVVYVKFLMLRRLMLSRDPSARPVYGDPAKQRSHDGAVAESELRRGDAATTRIAEAIRDDYNESSSPRFLAMRATAEPWLPRMPALATAARVCASNGICYDVREDARVRTYDREQDALVNHRVTSPAEDSFYLVDGSRFTMYRAADERREHALYRLPDSHPCVAEMTDADAEDAKSNAIVQRHVRLTLLHGHDALLHVRLCLFRGDETVAVPAEPIVCDDANGAVRVAVPPRHTAVVLLQRYVYDPLRERLESSWLDIDASKLQNREISIGAVDRRIGFTD